MAIRTLKRKVIIREYDYHKIADQALSIGLYADNMSLYDRVSWTPLNQDNLEKLKLIELLKGKAGPITKVDIDLTMPAMLVAQLKDYLYDEKYYHWNISIDSEGYMCVQSRKNTPKTRLGWGVFEKDIKCRI
jgi:hypothetical protein